MAAITRYTSFKANALEGKSPQSYQNMVAREIKKYKHVCVVTNKDIISELVQRPLLPLHKTLKHRYSGVKICVMKIFGLTELNQLPTVRVYLHCILCTDGKVEDASLTSKPPPSCSSFEHGNKSEIKLIV